MEKANRRPPTSFYKELEEKLSTILKPTVKLYQFSIKK